MTPRSAIESRERLGRYGWVVERMPSRLNRLRRRGRSRQNALVVRKNTDHAATRRPFLPFTQPSTRRTRKAAATNG